MKQVNEPGRQWVGNDQLEDHAEATDTSSMSDAGSVKTMLLEGASRSECDQSSVGLVPEELGQAVLVEQAVLPGHGESFKALVVELDEKGGAVWLLPQDDATIQQSDVIEGILDATSGEPEMMMFTAPLKDSCWMVDNPRPLRVRVEHGGFTGGLVVVRSIDFGFSMSLPPNQLRPIPVGLRSVQGTAVCSRLSTFSENKVMQGEACVAMVENGRVTLVADELHGQLEERSCEEIFWEPMAAHHANPCNPLQDDLCKEVDGYTSSRPICAFYQNRGSCYKGNFCQDLHTLPRHGAVTVDTEVSVVVSNYSADLLPQVARRWLGGKEMVETQFCSALSLTQYYLTFPNGLADVVGGRGQYKQWWRNFQQFYSKESSRLLMKALPAPGKHYVAGSTSRGWHRVLAQGVVDDEVEVLLVDEGRHGVVELGSVCDLDPSFSQLPHQAVLCCLAGVEPAASDVDANDILIPLLKDSHLSVQPPVDLEKPLLVELMLGDQRLSDLLVSRGLATNVRCDDLQ